MTKTPKVIGLTGPIASGKGVVAKYLISLGFSNFTLSDIIKDEATKRGLPHERQVLQDIGNEMRENFGNDILARIISERISDESGNVVIDSIRNPGEVAFLKGKYNFYLIGIQANEDKRFVLGSKRGTERDKLTPEEFQSLAARDLGIGEKPSGQQVDECLKLSDIILMNDLDEENLRDQVKNTLESLGFTV